MPNIEAKERRPLTDEEVQLITRTYADHRMGVPALLLLYCGLRRGELLALTWNDINFKKKCITVNKAAVYVNNQAIIKSPNRHQGYVQCPFPIQ